MIHIIITGGTFDKVYDELTGQLTFKDSHIPKLLERSRLSIPTQITQLMMVDSLEMTEAQRYQILNLCQQVPESQIIITHGTDTIVQTGQLLSEHISNKTVILTGAMVPVRISNSDGLFNLGTSIAFVQTLPTGIYISINGKYFSPNNVTKNKQTGIFELNTTSL